MKSLSDLDLQAVLSALSQQSFSCLFALSYISHIFLVVFGYFVGQTEPNILRLFI